MDENKIRGSIWRKWDLHLHSLKTHLNNNYSGVDNDTFVKKIKDEQIDVVGLTNYFTFTKEDFELKKKLEDNGVTVFLNLEVRLSYQNKEDDCCDAHIVFDSTVGESEIDNLLAKLNVDVGSSQKMTKNLSGIDDYEKATVELDHLKETLDVESLGLSDRYLIGFLSRGKGNGRSSTNYEKIAKKSHFLIHSSDREENLEEDKKFWLSKNKPLFQSSDAHSIDRIGAKYTWIKSDTTFDGLKQVLCEPDARALIQDRNPSDSKTARLIINKVTYKNSDDSEETIHFNGDLNSIIGSRGSGKSTLLKNLARRIDPDEFAKRDKKPPYSLSQFEVEWGDGQKNEGSEDSPKSVFYIPQGYLSALAYDDGERASERDVFLTQLLKKNERFSNAISSFDNFVAKNRIKIEELIQKLLTAHDTIDECKRLLKKQGSSNEIKEEIKKKNEQIKKHKGTNITDDEVKAYSDARKAVDEDSSKLSIIEQDEEILKKIKDAGANIFISDQEFNLLSSSRQELLNKELQKKSKESLETLIGKELTKITEQIKKLKKTVADNEKIVKKLSDKIKKSKALQDLTKELSTLEKNANNIDKLSKDLKKAEKDKTETINTLGDAYASFESQQNLIYKTIKFDEKFSFLQVEIVAHYDTEQLKMFVERNINTRDTSQALKSDRDIKTLFGDSPTKPSKDTIKKLIGGLIDETIRIKVEAGDIGAVIAQLLKNRFEIDYLTSVKTKNGKTDFRDMTGGQKAIALLELIFRFDDEKYPILIDQPEDDLDVSGIASDLVNFVSNEKAERQIIIVTHNASLVICADTENVVVSSISSTTGSGYDFSYSTGSIENPDRRDDIVRILEGGEDALRKRMQKLNIN